MHEVDSRWGWAIHKYPHYEEVGIEDVTFVGHATDDFSITETGRMTVLINR